MSHAIFSPSQLSRIIACPASAKYAKEFNNNTSSYAEEGTMLHEVVADTLAKGIHPHWDKLTPEQQRAVESCVDYANEIEEGILFSGVVASISIERHVTLGHFNLPEIYGTADLIIQGEKELHVIDWKFGQGVPVQAEGNVQLKAYALGAMAQVAGPIMDIPDLEIVTHVAQPRLNSFTREKLTVVELMNFAEMLRGVINHAESTNPPFNAGEEQCRWCNAKRSCEARHKLANTLASEAFAMFKREPGATDEERAELLLTAPMLITYLEEIKKDALAKMLQGQEFPGHKLVAGRSSRKWDDPDKALKYLLGQGVTEEELYERKFLTAPKAEKLRKGLKNDPEFIKLYVKTPGKPAVVPVTDKRPEFKAPDASEVFKNFKN